MEVKETDQRQATETAQVIRRGLGIVNILRRRAEKEMPLSSSLCETRFTSRALDYNEVRWKRARGSGHKSLSCISLLLYFLKGNRLRYAEGNNTVDKCSCADSRV